MGMTTIKINERHERNLHWRYTCNPPYASAMVAAINVLDGVPFDWAVYWGGGSSQREMDCVNGVLETGNKIEKELAEFLFPEIAAIDEPGFHYRR